MRIVAILLAITQLYTAYTRHIGSTKLLWEPKSLSRDEWLRFNGMPFSEWMEIRLKHLKLLRLYATIAGEILKIIYNLIYVYLADYN